MRAFISLAIVAFIIYVAFTCNPVKEDPVFINRYAAAWSDPGGSTLPAIAKTLMKNKVRVCASFYIKEHKKNSGEYLVACTPDGTTWYYLQVWPNIDEVLQVPDQGFAPPHL